MMVGSCWLLYFLLNFGNKNDLKIHFCWCCLCELFIFVGVLMARFRCFVSCFVEFTRRIKSIFESRASTARNIRSSFWMDVFFFGQKLGATWKPGTAGALLKGFPL